MKGLKDDNEANAYAEKYAESLEKSVNERPSEKMHLQLAALPKSRAKVPKTYFDYSVDSANAPLYIDVSVWVSYNKV